MKLVIALNHKLCHSQALVVGVTQMALFSWNLEASLGETLVSVICGHPCPLLRARPM